VLRLDQNLLTRSHLWSGAHTHTYMQCVRTSLSRGLHSDSGQRQDSRHRSILGTLRPQVTRFTFYISCFCAVCAVCCYLSHLIPLAQCSVLLPVTPDSSLLSLVHCSVLLSVTSDSSLLFPAHCCILLPLASVFLSAVHCCVLLSLKDTMLRKRHTRGAAEGHPCERSNVC